jgi:AcrR family transcriptional regulator
VTTTTDGRSTRWDQHRAHRRAELVNATIQAIRSHGAGVGMDEIAATAGTSKTVIYRHFTDRTGLYAAVVEQVDERLRISLARALTRPAVIAAASGPATTDATSGTTVGRDVLEAAIDTYLDLVERDPTLYRFIVAAPMLDPDDHRSQLDAGGLPVRVTARITEILGGGLGTAGHPTEAAAIWAAALVGMVRAAADDWLRPGSAVNGRPRAELCTTLTDLAWRGLADLTTTPMTG